MTVKQYFGTEKEAREFAAKTPTAKFLGQGKFKCYPNLWAVKFEREQKLGR